MTVKRYDAESDPQDGPCSIWMEEAAEGHYVTYSDYQKVVTENAALKGVFNPVDIPSEITDAFGDTAVIEHDSTGDNQGHSVSWSWVGNQEDVIKAILSAISLNHKTPNTDAFTAELRAQGVDDFIAHCQRQLNTNTYTEADRNKFTAGINTAAPFAANLRAGRKG